MVWLKVLVVVMGLLIVGGLTAVVFTIAQRVGDTGSPSEGFGRVNLNLAESCRIADSAVDGERLVLRLDGPAKDGCAGVVVVDLGAGRVLGRVVPGPAR